jgi:hypothetical protein
VTRLVEALNVLGLRGEVELGGRWLKLDGAHCSVFVVEEVFGASFYTWCDDPRARSVEQYHDPAEAILAGLRRAERIPEAAREAAPSAGKRDAGRVDSPSERGVARDKAGGDEDWRDQGALI